MGAIGGSVESWGLLYDETDPVQRALARIARFDPAAPTRKGWTDFLELRLLMITTAELLGPNGMAHLDDPIIDGQGKLDRIVQHLRDGRSWPSVEGVLGIPWSEQVRLLVNGHATRLWTWEPEQRVAFQEAAREGATVGQLQRDFGLPYHQTRTLHRLCSPA